MKSSTKDNAVGKLHQVTGKLKEVVGKVLKNRSLQAEGKAENLNGHVQEKISEIEKMVDK